MRWLGLLASLFIPIFVVTAVGQSNGAPDAGKVISPKIRREIKADYPQESRRKNEQGKVLLEVVVDPSGTPVSVRSISGKPRLARAAVDAVKRWRWEPWEPTGTPLWFTTHVEITFAGGWSQTSIEDRVVDFRASATPP